MARPPEREPGWVDTKVAAIDNTWSACSSTAAKLDGELGLNVQFKVMDTDSRGGEWLQPSEPDFFDLVERLDSLRDDIFAEMARYSRLPSVSNLERLRGAVAEQTDVLKLSLIALDKAEDDSAQKADAIASLFLDEDEKRVSFLNYISSEKTHVTIPVSREELKEEIKNAFDHADDSDEAVAAIMASYKTSFEYDLNELLEEVRRSSAGKLLENAKKVSKHALDVGKIAAGVAVGILIVKQRRNHY